MKQITGSTVNHIILLKQMVDGFKWKRELNEVSLTFQLQSSPMKRRKHK